MKNLIFILFVCVAGSLHAQIPPANTKPKTQTTPAIKNEEILSREWKLISWETFGIVKPTDEANNKDMLLMNADGSFKLIFKNIEKTGKWKRAGSYIHFAQEGTTEKIAFKLLSLQDKTLKVDWREEDATHHTLTYSNP